MQLEFKVVQQTITQIGGEGNGKPASNSSAYLTAHFTFSDDWLGVKYALFKHGGDKNSVEQILDAGNTCKIPEMVLRTGNLYISAYCKYGTPETGDVRITADTWECVTIRESLYGDNMIQPSPVDAFTNVRSPAGAGVIKEIRRNTTTGVFEYSQDGVTWYRDGDMKKSVYDTANKGFVDKAGTLDGLTASIAELNRSKGVTSDIQPQINAVNASIADITAECVNEVQTVNLTNSSKYPFNNSLKTISLQKTRKTLNYDVEYEIVSTNGNIGDIAVTDKQLNGFKVAFDGSATAVMLKCRIKGGMLV